MSVPQVFARIVAALDLAGIPFMLTGSFASSVHGSPRATRDIDLVIDPTPESLRALAKLLPPEEYYHDETAALDALSRRSQFNVLDHATGWKVDLIIRKSRPFSRAEFERRQVLDFDGVRLAVATAEDVVLAKLEWAKTSGSRRQIEDAAGVLMARAGEIDIEWIERWVVDLDIAEQWSEARQRAGLAPGNSAPPNP